MRFDCPRCGEEITTERSVGEFTSCETCKAYLKILGEDIAAVFSGNESAEPEDFEDCESSPDAEMELQTAVLTALQEVPEDKTVNQYSCPCCLSLVITSGKPGEKTRCEDCGTELKIVSGDSLAPISDAEEKTETRIDIETKQNLTLKTKNKVEPSEAELTAPPSTYPRILKFTCPQCDEEVKTQRSPGESFICYKCGGELKILSEDSVALVLGDDEPLTDKKAEFLPDSRPGKPESTSDKIGDYNDGSKPRFETENKGYRSPVISGIYQAKRPDKIYSIINGKRPSWG